MSVAEKLVQGLSAFFLVALLSFFVGTAVGRYELWPFPVIAEMKNAAVSYIKSGGVYAKNQVFTRVEGDGRPQITVLNSDGLMPGYVAVMGFDTASHSYAVTLLDESRKPVHQWLIDYDALDEDGPSGRTDQPHGLHIRKDGSIIVNFDQGDVMARMGVCSELVP